jgi:hypothetical protein
MVPKYSNAGVLNKVSLPATINAAYVNALINNNDRSLRWYPLPKHVNAEISKEASVYESFNDGSKKFVHEGVSNFKCIYASTKPNFLGILKSGRCTEMACYLVDKNSALIGLTNGEENVLYPFALNANTIDAIMKWASDTTGLNIEYMFEFDTDQQDEYVNKIDSADMVGVNLLVGYDGLVDAIKSQTSTGQTSMVFKLYAQGGSIVPVPITGLLAADFALYNNTTAAAITVITAVETVGTPGTYTLTYASQTIGNIVKITPTLAKYDFTNVIAAVATVA